MGNGFLLCDNLLSSVNMLVFQMDGKFESRLTVNWIQFIIYLRWLGTMGAHILCAVSKLVWILFLELYTPFEEGIAEF